MSQNIRFVHTNIVAKDWKNLAQFYIDVFGCEPVYPERDLAGEWLEKLTAINGAEIRGMHLRLPGYQDGPTLEIFQYNISSSKGNAPLINAQGFAHIAFHVDDVEATLNTVLTHGGEKYGELVEKDIHGDGRIKVIYVKDPEGNIIEIQHWNRQ
ncbi:MAG: VOC family protein [Bacteroidales bacterium]|nr:VOC family protein [Bacteroidales bacterium]